MSYSIPRVAVITRTKDRPLMLRRAIESVLKQSFQDWLHVVVNDGGDPTTVQSVISTYLERYQGRLKVLHNEKSLGMQNASNRAIRETDSEYIVIHDDDDSWTPVFLSECVKSLDSFGADHDIQGVATQSVWIFEEIDGDGNIVEVNRQDYFPFKEISLFRASGTNPFPPIAFLYRRKAHDQIGYFDQQFDYVGDWDFNLRFLSKFEIGVIENKLACYHWRHKAGDSPYGNTVTDGIEAHRQLVCKMRNHYLRQDLNEGRIGLGFLMNLSESFQGNSSMLWDLKHRSNEVLDKIHYLEHMSRYFEKITCDLNRLWIFKRYIERAGSYLLDKASSLLRRPAKEATAPLEFPMETLRRSFSEVQVVSFDVFDTTLLRKVKRPVDVFLYMENEARHLMGNQNVQFPDLRVNAERIARERASEQHGYGDATLKEIYSALQELTGVNDETIKSLIELEIRAEEALIYANPRMLELYRLAQSEGKQITFTSDMYLPGADVARLLEMNGFSANNLLVSSEARLTKHSGELFDLVVERFGENPERILHIGDNEWSDFEQAKRKKLRSLHWRPSERTAIRGSTSLLFRQLGSRPGLQYFYRIGAKTAAVFSE